MTSNILFRIAKKNILVIAVVCMICFFTYVCMKYIRSKRTESFSDDNTPNKTLIFFKANMCSHCKRFKPVWDEFVEECKRNNEKTALLELDVENEEAKPLIEKHKVKGFPHVVLVAENKDDIVFTSNRTKEDLLTFLSEHVH